MNRLLLLLLLFVSAGLAQPAAAQTDTEGLPPRPKPFRFVNDQACLMAPADAKKLENGLRRYADNTGTQVVVVTVPSLGGRSVADYGRALGNAWGVGQRDKNNGVVVLVSAQEHQLTIQPGSGLQSAITPEVTNRVISQMTPSFKQGNYFAGLRSGLNTLMAAADPNAASRQNAASAGAGTAATGAASGTSAGNSPQTNMSQEYNAPVPATDPTLAPPPSEPVSSGPGMGTVLLGALVVGGILWFVVKMFRRRSAANTAASSPTPDFLPNRPGGPSGSGANFGAGRPQGGNFNQNQGYGGGFGGGANMGSGGGGIGMGGILATGAAAAAGAYLGNRMAEGHTPEGHNLAGDGTTGAHFDPSTGAAAAGGAAGLGTGAASDYFSSRDGGNGDNTTGPDYFSDAATADDNSGDYFSLDDNSSYDDFSSDDTGGGGFDSGDDNSGSW